MNVSQTPELLSRDHPVLSAVYEELLKSYRRFPQPIHSLHEGYALILEELDEFWEEVKKNPQESNSGKLRYEAIQTAAMALRTIIDLIELPHEC